MKLRFQFAAHGLAFALLSVLALLACDGKVEPPATDGAVDATASADPDAGTPEGLCLLDGDVCAATSGARCCEPRGLFRVDLARDCKEVKRTPFECRPQPVREGVKSCGQSDESSCLWRAIEGGDGGAIEVFFSEYYIRLAGFTECDGELLGRAMSAASHGCP